MKPYPVEFRQKIIDVYEKENISIRKLASRFFVSKNFIQNLLKQYKETGDITPRKQGGSPPAKLKGEDLVTLIEIIENNNDATLVELCDLLEEQTGIKISKSTMGRITLKLNYTVKKNSSRYRKRK